MRNNRWFILAVLFVTRFCLGYQFQSAGSVAPFLMAEFSIDYGQVGTLVGLFMLPGLVFALPGGLLGKRFGDKRIVMMGMAAMILGGMLSGVAQSYALISVGRLISGVGGVFLVVLMAKMVTDWFAGKELFLGMAIFIIGWPVGIAAAQATQASLAEAKGWSVVFILTALMMTLALASMAVFYRDAPARGDVSTAPTAHLNRTEAWLVCIAGAIWMFINGAYVVMLSFGPTLLVERGTSVTDAAQAVSIMSWVFLFALPLGGWLSTHYKASDVVNRWIDRICDNRPNHTICWRSILDLRIVWYRLRDCHTRHRVSSSRNFAARQSSARVRDLLHLVLRWICVAATCRWFTEGRHGYRNRHRAFFGINDVCQSVPLWIAPVGASKKVLRLNKQDQTLMSERASCHQVGSLPGCCSISPSSSARLAIPVLTHNEGAASAARAMNGNIA